SYQAGNVTAKAVCKFCERYTCVFHRVMQEPGHDQICVQRITAGSNEFCNFNEMVDVRLAACAFALLLRMFGSGKLRSSQNSPNRRSAGCWITLGHKFSFPSTGRAKGRNVFDGRHALKIDECSGFSNAVLPQSLRW